MNLGLDLIFTFCAESDYVDYAATAEGTKRTNGVGISATRGRDSAHNFYTFFQMFNILHFTI